MTLHANAVYVRRSGLEEKRGEDMSDTENSGNAGTNPRSLLCGWANKQDAWIRKVTELVIVTGRRLTWTPDWLSVSGRLVVECPPGVGHLGGCPVGEP